MIRVIKANGQVEPFSETKLLGSIQRAGVPRSAQLDVLRDIEKTIYDNIPTSTLYAQIIDSLSKNHPHSRGKYSLKQAIMLLGPTGYPFEDFVSKLLAAQGYQTRIRQTLWGKCVSHEVDVIAEKDNNISMVEAKFHNSPGARSDVHVTLYTYARFLDLKEKFQFNDAWVITNTKMTLDAIAYAECMKMRIVSWAYPQGNSLREMIERSKLHPITMLMSLTSSQKMKLLQEHVVMCKDLRKNVQLLDNLALSSHEKQSVTAELDAICA